MDTLGIILSVLSVVGGFLVSWKRVEGFYLWVVANAGWIVWCLIHNTTSQIGMWTIYLVTALLGIYKCWESKEDQKEQKRRWNATKKWFKKIIKRRNYGRKSRKTN